jgi:8-oxo-dGTP diphosphatase
MIQFGEFNAGVDYVERSCAYAVIHNESGEIAVVRTRKGYFLPGGGIHSDETPEQALIREVVEETGYASVILGHIGTAAQYTYARKKRIHYRKIGHFFAARFTAKVGAPIEMDHELFWHSVEDAEKKMKHGFQSWAIRQAPQLRLF